MNNSSHPHLHGWPPSYNKVITPTAAIPYIYLSPPVRMVFRDTLILVQTRDERVGWIPASRLMTKLILGSVGVDDVDAFISLRLTCEAGICRNAICRMQPANVAQVVVTLAMP